MSLVGSMGVSVTRTPVAWAMALATAAAVGMVAGSPIPFAPTVLHSVSSGSMGQNVISAGTSIAVGIL